VMRPRLGPTIDWIAPSHAVVAIEAGVLASTGRSAAAQLGAASLVLAQLAARRSHLVSLSEVWIRNGGSGIAWPPD
jgi:hypothetical protein